MAKDKYVQFVQTSPEDFSELILERLKEELEGLKKGFQPIKPTEYLTRKDVVELLKINLSTETVAKRSIKNNYNSLIIIILYCFSV